MVEVELLDHTPDPEKVIERTMLITRNLWPNIPYENKTLEERINLLWKRKHFGCFEKAYVTILAMKLSRVCTHQLVRHRLFSYNQLSMRVMEPNNLENIVPPSIKRNPVARELYLKTFLKCREAYQELRVLGIPREDARFVIPMGIETQIEITGNFRSWLHFINTRTNPAAQWEIRELAHKSHELLKSISPNVFSEKYEKMWVYV
jgi:thymidylate synthase (FAD)